MKLYTDFWAFLLSPYYLYKLLFKEYEKKEDYLKSRIFLFVLLIYCWTLMFILLESYVIGFICANLFLFSMISGNYYSQTDYKISNNKFYASVFCLLMSVGVVFLAFMVSYIAYYLYLVYVVGGTVGECSGGFWPHILLISFIYFLINRISSGLYLNLKCNERYLNLKKKVEPNIKSVFCVYLFFVGTFIRFLEEPEFVHFLSAFMWGCPQ